MTNKKKQIGLHIRLVVNCVSLDCIKHFRNQVQKYFLGFSIVKLRAKEALKDFLPVCSILTPSPDWFQRIQSDLRKKHLLLASSPAACVTNMIFQLDMLL